MALKILKDGKNPTNTNSYLVFDDEKKFAYLIDPSNKSKLFQEKIEELNLKLKYILLTHAHWDHILKLDYWKQKYNVKVIASEFSKDYLSNPNLNLSSNIGEEIIANADIYLSGEYGKVEIFEYFYTPGHSYDSLVFKLGDVVFCGDVIFLESVGRTDFPGSNSFDLNKSIKNVIYNFNDNTILLPGHGANTTVEHEKKYNPFVRI